MDLLDMMKERYSVRSFSDKPVEREKLDKILLAAKHAPTAANKQPQKIYVIRSEEGLAKINSVCRFLFHAKTVLLVCYDDEIVWRNSMKEGVHSGEIDAAITGQNMVLEAWNLGVGSCWVAYFNPDDVAAAMELPKNIHPVFLLPIGYPTDDCVPLAKWHDVFRPMEEMVEEV